MKNTYPPSWASRVTTDIAIPHVAEDIATELKHFDDTPISLIWRRVSARARKALTEWWES